MFLLQSGEFVSWFYKIRALYPFLTSPFFTDTADEDPIKSGNSIPSLLTPDSSTITHLMGIDVTVLPPVPSPDIIPAFNAAAASHEEIGPYAALQVDAASTAWSPVPWPSTDTGEKQWLDTIATWTTPALGNGASVDATNVWIETLNWKKSIPTTTQNSSLAKSLSLGATSGSGGNATPQPVSLDGRRPGILLQKDVFEQLYLAVPVVSQG
jgi:hypothetical protein